MAMAWLDRKLYWPRGILVNFRGLFSRRSTRRSRGESSLDSSRKPKGVTDTRVDTQTGLLKIMLTSGGHWTTTKTRRDPICQVHSWA